jgi:hypothetical protein
VVVTIVAIIIVVVVVVVTVVVLLSLVHAVGTHGGNLGNVEALVGADALVLEVMLIGVVVAPQVDIALVGELADGPADVLARVGDIVHVDVDLGVDAEEERGNGEDDVTRVVHDGRMLCE